MVKLPRILYKKNTILKICITFGCIFIFRNYVIFKSLQNGAEELGNFIYLKRREGQCKLPNDNWNEELLFTHNLPEETDYLLVPNNGNPNFKEYVIPTKSIDSAAYMKILDKLNVLIIPFSHVDPGYGLTMEEYYRTKTRHTLSNMVTKLDQYKNMTFQWAEVVYLERWWRDISDDVKERVRALIQEGRLEIVLGGWVMPDEAVTHYEPVVDQLVEGHQWLFENLGVRPKNSWVNDPFGYSNTFPYLWKKSGMENMVILRIHQAIKATLMKKQSLEFHWKQMWSEDKSNAMFCHIMPYRGYWIGDVCGPNNQHICREYAFMHLDPRDKVVFVNKNNVDERARILYEQYRVTAELYRRDQKGQLFLPIFLGEDFSYVSERDFDLIQSNYKQLFDFMNSKPEWNINIKFGTLNEYFSAVKEYNSQENKAPFSSLTGDFFPYSDYQNDYWTGYFTTRPFLKRLSRLLQRSLKAVDVYHSYAILTSGTSYENVKEVGKLLTHARRELGMFLHHDGITGTSVLHVMNDFRLRLDQALTSVSRAYRIVLSQILTNGTSAHGNINDLSIDTQKESSVIEVPRNGFILVAANPLPRRRRDVIKLLSRKSTLSIYSGNKNVSYQVNDLHNGLYEISFFHNFTPMSLAQFTIMADSNDHAVVSSLQTASENSPIFIENSYLRVYFDKISGFINQLELKTGSRENVAVDSEVLAYDALRSGAYIFAPDGEAKKRYLTGSPDIKIRNGQVTSEVIVTYKGYQQVTKLYHLQDTKGQGVFITTNIDMTDVKISNKEVILRLKTNISNKNIFFTDQNGFQLTARKTYVDRPVEQNYYPLTTMFVIEDDSRRFTLHSAQPHGVSSLNSGWMEIMLDRKLSRDDGKGLGQGIFDNVPTTAEFVLHLETKRNTPRAFNKDVKYTYPSASAIQMNELLNNPVLTSTVNSDGRLIEGVAFISSDLPCDVSIAGMRQIKQDSLNIGLLLRRWVFNCDFEVPESICHAGQSSVTLSKLFNSQAAIAESTETSLTFLDILKHIDDREDLSPSDMELRAFVITRR